LDVLEDHGARQTSPALLACSHTIRPRLKARRSMASNDWDQPGLWRRAMEELAKEVMPNGARHAA